MTVHRLMVNWSARDLQMAVNNLLSISQQIIISVVLMSKGSAVMWSANSYQPFADLMLNDRLICLQ